MANPSLSEYLAQSQRGLYQSVFGPEYLMKQTYFTVDTATGIFNTTYGRKVWQALNQPNQIFQRRTPRGLGQYGWLACPY